MYHKALLSPAVLEIDLSSVPSKLCRAGSFVGTDGDFSARDDNRSLFVAPFYLAFHSPSAVSCSGGGVCRCVKLRGYLQTRHCNFCVNEVVHTVLFVYFWCASSAAFTRISEEAKALKPSWSEFHWHCSQKRWKRSGDTPCRTRPHNSEYHCWERVKRWVGSTTAVCEKSLQG